MFMKYDTKGYAGRFLLLALTFSCLLSSSADAQSNTITKERIEAVLNEAYNKFKDLKEGKNADYIKELATVDPNIFGIVLVTTDGQVYTKGDISSMVSIQSVSKVFTMAKVIEEMGHQAVQDKIGVDATGMRFNSIVAVELQRGKEINPLVNPGAIAASSLVKGADSAAKWKSIMQVHSDFAGRQLSLDMPVYISEAGDNLRNQSIAHLLLRSEEHTSELQSQSNLVCRLLLEKKKTKARDRATYERGCPRTRAPLV